VDNLRELKELKWCDHSPVVIQSYLADGYTHVSMHGGIATHLVVEKGTVKILCHACFCSAMQLRFDDYATHLS